MNGPSTHHELPDQIHQLLYKKYGEIKDIEPLGGITSGDVYLLTFKDKNLVAKNVHRKREIQFYEEIAPKLQDLNIPTAHLEWSGAEQDLPWIVIEYLPFALSEHRWEADKEVMEYLASVHSLDLNEVSLNDPFLPQWTEEMTERAMDCFDPSEQPTLKDKLHDIRQSCENLFRPSHLISGDANPKNWGLRVDGTLVQFDWHRIGLGHPAIDIATSICSSENLQTAQKASHIYLEKSPGNLPDTSTDDFTNDILKACVWNYIQFLDSYMQGEVQIPEKLVEHLVEHFPVWLEATPIQLK